MVEKKKRNFASLKNAKSEVKIMIESMEEDPRSAGTGKKVKSRKEVRKQARLLKKMRNDAFHHHRKLPTKESIQKEEDEEIKKKNKLKKIREKNKRKRMNRKERKKEEEMEKQAKERDLQMANKADNKTIKELEKKLKIKKRKKRKNKKRNDDEDEDEEDEENDEIFRLPNDFKQDNLAYLLSYKDDAHGNMDGFNLEDDEVKEDDNEDGDFEEEEEIEVDLKNSDDEDSNDDNEDEEEDVGPQRKKVRFSMDVEKERSKKRKHVEENEEEEEREDDDDEEKEKNESEDNEQDDNDNEEENEKNDSYAEEDEKEKNVDKDEEEEEEDIYGRPIKLSALYSAAARRNNNNDDYTNSNNEALNREVFSILNRLTESSIVSSTNKIALLTSKHTLQHMTSSLQHSIKRVCLDNHLNASQQRNYLTHQCMFLACIHHTQSALIPPFIQFITTSFMSCLNGYEKDKEDNKNKKKKVENDDEEEDDDEDTDDEDDDMKKMNVLLFMLCHLFNFKVIESVLLLDIMERLVQRFSMVDIRLLLLLLKEAGPRMRQDDAANLKTLLGRLLPLTTAADEEDVKKRLLQKSIATTLNNLKNNQLHKIHSFDHKQHMANKKIISTATKGQTSTPLRVGLKDIEEVHQKGKWWVVGSAWKGNTEHTLINNNTSTNLPKHLCNLANKLNINTPIKNDVFIAIMTSQDYQQATESILKLSKKHHADVMPVILVCALAGKKYNAFYATLAEKLCNHHRKFMMACKFAIWDSMQEAFKKCDARLQHLTTFVIHMILHTKMSLSVLKKVGFETMTRGSGLFVKKVLSSCLFRHQLFTLNKNNKHLKTYLIIFINHFFIKNRHDDDGGGEDDGGDLVRDAKEALRRLEESADDDDDDDDDDMFE